ncbi:hypothetical protein SDC9_119229 [bioreactor metagenome]|uniref:Uncharacterized protein n=1 Tax=bioreactor metagenome TaxID=1076179 RepID=A0A645C366_9ZZZZ
MQLNTIIAELARRFNAFSEIPAVKKRRARSALSDHRHAEFGFEHSLVLRSVHPNTRFRPCQSMKLLKKGLRADGYSAQSAARAHVQREKGKRELGGYSIPRAKSKKRGGS